MLLVRLFGLLIATASPAVAQAPTTIWTRAVAPGQGTPAGAWVTGTWPMGATAIAGPGGKLWMLAEGWAWSSSDQTTWERQPNRLPFGIRSGMAYVYFDNKLWAYGGVMGSTPKNDVW